MECIGTRFAPAFVMSLLTAAVPAQWVTVDLSAWANARIQTYQPGAATYPEGPVVLGGVPFDIQTVGGNNAWNAEVVTGPYPHVLDVPINVCAATEVHTLINTFYGQPGPTSYITLEFYGSQGAYYGKDLIGNVDVRDHLYANWTNSINNTTTINVFSTGGGFLNDNRLDKQQIVLPAAFATQTLSLMRLTSTGGVSVSDASIQGLTVLAASSFPCGQVNTPCASLVVNGIGTSGPGPFLANVPAGSTLSLAWSGAANQPLALLASPSMIPGQMFVPGFLVDLDLAHATVMFSGLDPLAFLLFSTNSSMGAFGTATQSFAVPAAAAGGTLFVQGVVFDFAGQCAGGLGLMSTASFDLRF